MSLIKPYASDDLLSLFVDSPKQREELNLEASSLSSLLLNSTAAANVVMLGSGYFNPLTGFMDKADALSVAREMKTTSGMFWPIPIVNLNIDAPSAKVNDRIALRDPNLPGNPVIAIQTVTAIEQLSDDEQLEMVSKIFASTDLQHPGVANFLGLGRYLVSGPIQVLHYSYFEQDYADTFRTAGQLREQFTQLGWSKIVAFQTRNPMHRAHEELCKIAQQQLNTDGILIHMLLGKLKPGDIPAQYRDRSIRTMVKHYFPANQVMVSGYGFDMLYAGPREALLHAIFRQNAGCTHLIIGRDHAGVGNYYGPFDAQTVFDTAVPKGSLQIEIFRADHTAYSKKLGRVIMLRDATDHSTDDFIQLSGTKVRELLSQGEALPEEFSRPEVAKVLMEYYQSL